MMVFDSEGGNSQEAGARFTFLNKGVPKEVLDTLLDIATPLDEVVKIVDEFNNSHQTIGALYRQGESILLSNGRVIKIYYDDQGGVRLGYDLGAEVQREMDEEDRKYAIDNLEVIYDKMYRLRTYLGKQKGGANNLEKVKDILKFIYELRSQLIDELHNQLKDNDPRP